MFGCVCVVFAQIASCSVTILEFSVYLESSVSDNTLTNNLAVDIGLFQVEYIRNVKFHPFKCNKISLALGRGLLPLFYIIYMGPFTKYVFTYSKDGR